MRVKVLWLAWAVGGCLAHDDPPEPVAAPVAAPVASRSGGRGVAAVAIAAVDDARRDASDASPRERQGPIARPDRFEAGPSPGEDEKLFVRAREAAESGDDQGMKGAYLRLIREYPQSPLVPEVFAALGDSFYGEGRFDDAARLFEKARQFTSAGPATRWSTYKLAWCRLELDDGARALEGFVAALRSIEAEPSSPPSDATLALAAAIREDLVRAYVEVGKPARAKVFFEHLGAGTGADAVPVSSQLRRLHELLVARGAEAEAAVVCGDLQAMDQPC
jgi:tetratricopeptide (TPR) repeat protein